MLGFAHTLKFGVVLMIGGSLAGQTRVASVALYEHVEAGDYASAHRLAAVLMVISVVLLWALFRWQRRAGAWAGQRGLAVTLELTFTAGLATLLHASGVLPDRRSPSCLVLLVRAKVRCCRCWLDCALQGHTF